MRLMKVARVSYTHLDVYKRQMYSSMDCISSKRCSWKGYRAIFTCSFYDFLWVWALYCKYAVSYTHLIGKISLDEEIPVMFGVVTTENIEQAIERAGTKAGNKGFDAAVSAIEMANLLKNIG